MRAFEILADTFLFCCLVGLLSSFYELRAIRRDRLKSLGFRVSRNDWETRTLAPRVLHAVDYVERITMGFVTGAVLWLVLVMFAMLVSIAWDEAMRWIL